MTTLGVTLEPVYDETTDANGRVVKRTLRGYRRATTSRKGQADRKAGALAQQWIAKGANAFGGLAFDYDQKDARYDALRGDAVRDALRKATSYTRGSGSGSGASSSIGVPGGGIPAPDGATMSARAAPPPPPPQSPSSRACKRCASRSRSAGSWPSNHGYSGSKRSPENALDSNQSSVNSGRIGVDFQPGGRASFRRGFRAFQRVLKPHPRRARPQRLLLALMRRPAGDKISSKVARTRPSGSLKRSA